MTIMNFVKVNAEAVLSEIDKQADKERFAEIQEWVREFPNKVGEMIATARSSANKDLQWLIDRADDYASDKDFATPSAARKCLNPLQHLFVVSHRLNLPVCNYRQLWPFPREDQRGESDMWIGECVGRLDDQDLYEVFVDKGVDGLVYAYTYKENDLAHLGFTSSSYLFSDYISYRIVK